MNAVAHLDYAILGSRVLLEVFDDRVDVTSPGTLPNHTTPESVMAVGHPRSRNESMASFLQVRRLMEQRGRGGPLLRRWMREFNGTEPILLEDRAGEERPVTRRRSSSRPGSPTASSSWPGGVILHFTFELTRAKVA